MAGRLEHGPTAQRDRQQSACNVSSDDRQHRPARRQMKRNFPARPDPRLGQAQNEEQTLPIAG